MNVCKQRSKEDLKKEKQRKIFVESGKKTEKDLYDIFNVSFNIKLSKIFLLGKNQQEYC